VPRWVRRRRSATGFSTAVVSMWRQILRRLRLPAAPPDNVLSGENASVAIGLSLFLFAGLAAKRCIRRMIEWALPPRRQRDMIPSSVRMISRRANQFRRRGRTRPAYRRSTAVPTLINDGRNETEALVPPRFNQSKESNHRRLRLGSIQPCGARLASTLDQPAFDVGCGGRWAPPVTGLAVTQGCVKNVLAGAHPDCHACRARPVRVRPQGSGPHRLAPCAGNGLLAGTNPPPPPSVAAQSWLRFTTPCERQRASIVGALQSRRKGAAGPVALALVRA
jgi:hypothetical protein